MKSWVGDPRIQSPAGAASRGVVPPALDSNWMLSQDCVLGYHISALRASDNGEIYWLYVALRTKRPNVNSEEDCFTGSFIRSCIRFFLRFASSVTSRSARLLPASP